MGDFNTNLFDTTKSQIVRDFCIRAGLSVIHNCLPTHFTDNLSCSTLIDYFMVSEPDLVHTKMQYQMPVLNSGHSLISISYNVRIERNFPNYFFRDYRSLNLERCLQQLRPVNFSYLYNRYLVDDQIAFFNSVILENFEQNVPLRRARRPRYDKWMDTNDIKIARSKRNLAFRALREDNCEYNRNIYRINRNRLKSLIRRYRRNASINFFSNCNQTQFWSRLRSEGAIASKSESSMNQVNVEEFNCNSILPPIVDEGCWDVIFSSNMGFSFRTMDELEVYNTMNSIKTNAVGYDGIPIKYLKLIFPVIAKPLIFIFNKIITTSEFPSIWKIGRIVPVPKIKSPRLATNFRPIIILSCCSKILEILLRNQIQEYLGEKGLLSTFQSGYRENYNTTGLTLGVVEALRHNMDMKFESLAIFLDYSRAFDSISHSMLITKLLNSFKFDNTACKLIRSFLTGRRQFTEVEGRVSTILEIFRGIPQGSVLGPLLFMMYVNDIFSQVHFCLC
ncbi:uncharacterized protein LOC124418642 [Lucilia cuprina]|uniref:uncharacterized protein LOC124418642 n=1 Tax=Lucilia cuprina TaxID=7375 RepID=UPI001F06E2D6|nr:uncharacterized protein LOC124418642 [Lucilia cuprina]